MMPKLFLKKLFYLFSNRNFQMYLKYQSQLKKEELIKKYHLLNFKYASNIVLFIEKLITLLKSINIKCSQFVSKF